jgi:hypothetical protein
MVMGDHDPAHRFHTDSWASENRIPDLARCRRIEPTVDNRPTIVLFKQVDVDVIEREGQGQTQQQQAFGELEWDTHFDRISEVPHGGQIRAAAP